MNRCSLRAGLVMCTHEGPLRLFLLCLGRCEVWPAGGVNQQSLLYLTAVEWLVYISVSNLPLEHSNQKFQRTIGPTKPILMRLCRCQCASTSLIPFCTFHVDWGWQPSLCQLSHRKIQFVHVGESWLVDRLVI